MESPNESAFEAWLPEIKEHPERWIVAIIQSGELQLVMEVLRDHPQLINARPSMNRTLVLEAALAGRCEIVDALLTMGAKLDFISAVALGRTAYVAGMIADGPQRVRRRAPDSFSALHIAARYAEPDMLELLLSAGADVHDSLNRRRLTPIFFAITAPYRNAEVILENGGIVNARDIQGFTVLHFAASRGEARLVSFLLSHGADPNIQTKARQTPWALAVRRGHHSTAALL